VVRHAGTDECRVSIDQRDGQVSIEVTDSGRGASEAGTGYGITDDDDYVYGALRAGASGFLVKDMALEDILAAIRVVAAGDAIIAPGVTRRLIGQFAGQPSPGRGPRELPGITDREREVLRLVGLGMSNAEIAAALYITAGTAKTHVAHLLAKLGARDRVQLVITAYEAGLVSAPR
jgi:DNA-binding NarL/FixJ family response regulator